MKYILTLLGALILSVGLLIVLAQNPSSPEAQHSPDAANLETEIEHIFLYQARIDSGEKYDRTAKIQALGSKEAVADIILRMVAKYKQAEPGSKEYLYLTGAVVTLGALQESKASPELSKIIFDGTVHENVRAFATRSLGQIDPEINKEILLKALEPSSAGYYLIRVYAAEALAKTKDAEAQKVLEEYTQQERDPAVREKFNSAVQQIKANRRTL